MAPTSMNLIRRAIRAPQFRMRHRGITPSPAPQQTRLASSDYGSPSSKSDPASDPQTAGANPSADKEHPGPPPPKEGHSTGGGPTKAGKDGHETARGDKTKPTGQSGGQKRGFSTSVRRDASQEEKAKKEGKKTKEQTEKKTDARPKILETEAPGKEGQSEDVKKHNEEFEKRAGRMHGQAADKVEQVEKGSWGQDKDGKPAQG